MLALAYHEATRCHLCGGDLNECWDAASEGQWHVPLPTRCQRTTAIAAARKPYDKESVAPHALMFWAERKAVRP